MWRTKCLQKNSYEKLWKIKTSENKFKILPISTFKLEPIIVDNKQYNYNEAITILGLQLKATGINSHVTRQMNRAKLELSKLKRFQNLKPKTKIHLYKTYIRPLLEYPIVPLCGISKTNKIKLQTLQNKAVKFAIKGDDEELSIEDAHVKYKLEAYNVRLHRRGSKLWEKLMEIEPDLVNRSMAENENRDFQDHYWWRRIAATVGEDEPDPIYVTPS